MFMSTKKPIFAINFAAWSQDRAITGRQGRSIYRGRALEKIQFLSNQDAGAREDGAVHAELEMKEMMGIEKDMGEERVEG